MTTQTTVITISEHLGADVQTIELDAEHLAEHDDDTLEAAKELIGYSDADSIFCVEDARALAFYILEKTGGDTVAKLIERVKALGAAIENGDPQSIADAWVHHVTPALAATDTVWRA